MPLKLSIIAALTPSQNTHPDIVRWGAKVFQTRSSCPPSVLLGCDYTDTLDGVNGLSATRNGATGTRQVLLFSLVFYSCNCGASLDYEIFIILRRDDSSSPHEAPLCRFSLASRRARRVRSVPSSVRECDVIDGF